MNALKSSRAINRVKTGLKTDVSENSVFIRVDPDGGDSSSPKRWFITHFWRGWSPEKVLVNICICPSFVVDLCFLRKDTWSLECCLLKIGQSWPNCFIGHRKLPHFKVICYNIVSHQIWINVVAGGIFIVWIQRISVFLWLQYNRRRNWFCLLGNKQTHPFIFIISICFDYPMLTAHWTAQFVTVFQTLHKYTPEAWRWRSIYS
jgi:hypothetical protein